MDFTDEQVNIALTRYQKNREYQRQYYRKKYQTDLNFREKSKELAKNYYYDNIEKKKKNMNYKKIIYNQNVVGDIGNKKMILIHL